MEYVKGRTLNPSSKNWDHERRSCTCSYRNKRLTIGFRIAKALEYLHEKKLVHRDVKPANIFLSSATWDSIPSIVKLGDFGVTKWGDFLANAASGSLTVTLQQGFGTLKYMSPEQAVRPKDVNVRSDMFSLGITLYELFTGQILQSPHHVFEIMSARTSRDRTVAKLYSLGVKCPYDCAALFELILDMFWQARRSPLVHHSSRETPVLA